MLRSLAHDWTEDPPRRPPTTDAVIQARAQASPSNELVRIDPGQLRGVAVISPTELPHDLDRAYPGVYALLTKVTTELIRPDLVCHKVLQGAGCNHEVAKLLPLRARHDQPAQAIKIAFAIPPPGDRPTW